ncbi:MAG: allantoicase [Actinomycetota bacterium]|nr:allantoicase [Actinomycetota bacterium]
MSDFLELTDLADRSSGAGVVYANDEFFAEKENLLNPGRAKFASHTFGHKGQIYDGWETRRRRNEPGNDFAILRLGRAGIIKGVNIDTGNFTGNFPPHASVEAAHFDHIPTIGQLLETPWITILEKSPLAGDSENLFAILSLDRWTHVRLTMHPDGGIARFRVHGIPLPDTAWVAACGPKDLAALDNGGQLIGSSDQFYSLASNTLQAGRPKNQGDGWENRRRRGPGNDYFVVKLCAPGKVNAVEIDTTHYKGNAPAEVMVTAGSAPELLKGPGKVTLVNREVVQPDTPHTYITPCNEVVEFVRVDVFPDGGIGRFRVWGEEADK